ncbi:MAG TPA: DsbC family protein [Steroidobacteraceae bacterium]|nr:DsbC family protein [Steroidobacteraceae bacterium]
MPRILALLTLILSGAALNLRAAPAEQPHAEQPPADPRAALLKLLPAGSKLDDLRPSPIPGIYEFTQGAEVSYMTADGKYFIDGNLYDMKSRVNLTEELRTHARVALINAVPESQMVIFSPANPKYTLTVFTDVDCQYCRRLHSQIAELNRLGVRVRYMFFPRSGPGTESWRKAEVVWCSANRNEALTRAKTGAPLDMNKTCTPTPVAREYELGESLGVRGTPAMFSEYGDYINGYIPPQELVQQLKEMQMAQLAKR